MTISATTQGLRMGVATSTSRPTVPFDGQVISETDTDSLSVYKGSAWGSVSALVRVGGGALSGSSTAFASVFSATYDAYQIVVSNVQTSVVDIWLSLQLGSTTTGYYGSLATANYATGNFTGGGNMSNTSNWQYVFAISNPATNINGGSVTLFNPFQTKRTTMTGLVARLNTTGYGGSVAGFQDSDTSFTGFTLIPSSGTMTGTCNIYGYSLS